jgi:hypothetical protein
MSGYPFEAYEDRLESWLPPVWARGAAAVYIVEAVRQLGDLDLMARDTYDAFVRLDSATGWRLDALGAMVGEERGGLGDVEYRRLIDGRRIASSLGSGAVTYPRLWAGWRALTGLNDGVIETTAPGVGYVVAYVDFVPSSAYIARARPIWRAMLPACRVANAIVAGPGSLILGETPLGSGVLAAAIA